MVNPNLPITDPFKAAHKAQLYQLETCAPVSIRHCHSAVIDALHDAVSRYAGGSSYSFLARMGAKDRID